jgi:hypothetical protein
MMWEWLHGTCVERVQARMQTVALVDPKVMHGPSMTMKSIPKKVQKVHMLVLISEKQFYVYQLRHDFLQIHNGRGKFWPQQDSPACCGW